MFFWHKKLGLSHSRKSFSMEIRSQFIPMVSTTAYNPYCLYIQLVFSAIEAATCRFSLRPFEASTSVNVTLDVMKIYDTLTAYLKWMRTVTNFTKHTRLHQ